MFTDAWLQSIHFCGEFVVDPESNSSKEDKKKYEIKRMSFAYRRAAKAMLVTQMTTC